MTDAALILAAKPEDKNRIDAYLRELRSTKTEEELQRLPMMWAPLPTRSAPARPELTSGLSASSVPPSEPPAESLRLDLCHGCALDAAGIDDDGSTVAENYLKRRRGAFNTTTSSDYVHLPSDNAWRAWIELCAYRSRTSICSRGSTPGGDGCRQKV